MKKRRVMGVYAPPARPTPVVVTIGFCLLAVLTVALGLIINPYLAPFFDAR